MYLTVSLSLSFFHENLSRNKSKILTTDRKSQDNQYITSINTKPSLVTVLKNIHLTFTVDTGKLFHFLSCFCINFRFIHHVLARQKREGDGEVNRATYFMFHW